MAEETLLTVPQIAAQLHVGDDTVLRWLREGQLKGYRLGPKLFRVRSADLQEFLDQRLVTA